MRKLAPLFLLVLALPLFAFENIVIRDGDHSVSWGRDPRVAGVHGRQFAYFEKDGTGYVITDQAVLQRLMAETREQAEIGEEQARIGNEQARIGALQAEVGAQQAAIGAQQAAASDDRARSRELEAKQRKLQRRQEALAEQQQPLAIQQQELGEKQRVAGLRARAAVQKIFEEALRSGVAKRR
jgi:hypothetical protein